MESKKEEEPTITEEETKGGVTVTSHDEVAEEQKGPQTEEEKQKMKDNLMQLINQLSEKSSNSSDKKSIQMLKQLMPLYDKHDFWDTQPVPKTSMGKEKEMKDGPIEHKDVKDVQKDPIKLPDGFEWASIDLADDKQAHEVYELLRENYVEDSEHTFRFDYPIEFLRWALLVPGYKQEWHLGVRVSKTQKLLAFISGIPVKTKVGQQTVKMAEINYLCVHKKLRTKRLAPVLIKEITRRVNVTNVWQAIYTAGVVVPRPVTTACYYHRSLNPKKLIEVGFSSLPVGVPMARHLKSQKLPKKEDIQIVGTVREMTKKDVSSVTKLLNDHLNKYQIRLKLSENEVAHMLLPRPNVMFSYVVEDTDKKAITDFISYYRLPSQILKKSGHSFNEVNVTIKLNNYLQVAYSFYNVTTANQLHELMKFALHNAKENNFDVFNALDIMDNTTFLSELKFSQGDGYLHYYLYNWYLNNRLTPQQLGIVLV